jgi:hypothetical protein
LAKKIFAGGNPPKAVGVFVEFEDLKNLPKRSGLIKRCAAQYNLPVVLFATDELGVDCYLGDKGVRDLFPRIHLEKWPFRDDTDWE